MPAQNTIRFISITCSNCGAALEEDNGLDMFYCKYCGHKILMDGQSPESLNAKIVFRQMEHEERMMGQKYEHEQAVMDKEILREQSERQDKIKSDKYMFFGLLIAMLLLFFMCYMLTRSEGG